MSDEEKLILMEEVGIELKLNGVSVKNIEKIYNYAIQKRIESTQNQF